MNHYLDDGELPADFLAQYPVAQDELPVEQLAVEQRTNQRVNEQFPIYTDDSEFWTGYPPLFEDETARHGIDDWYIDDRIPWRRGLIAIFLLMATYMICGLWSM